MKSVRVVGLALVASALLSASLAWSQGGNPPASTKESGETSGHGMTAAEQTGGNAEQEVSAIADQMIQAWLKSDTSFFDKNSTADYTAIHSDGRLTTKAEEMDAFQSGALKYEHIGLREKKIRVYGNTALVISLSSSKGTLNGKPFSGDFRTTRTWVKQGGNWKMAAFQSTRAAAATQ
jgi:ketosteroid isomerase-like protein